jgi:hypothetical protein
LDALFDGFYEVVPVFTVGVGDGKVEACRSLEKGNDPFALLKQNFPKSNGIDRIGRH